MLPALLIINIRRRHIVKTIVVVLSLAISGVAISAAYFDAYASRMDGKGNGCSDGNLCMRGKYKAATAKPKQVIQPKKMGN
jgi:hypothetical protein